jgi:tol-pal system protein YbgF
MVGNASLFECVGEYAIEYVLGMIRFASLLVVALACVLCANAAGAQTSDADLLTRIDRLEAAIRDLTGSVEQLQYRNQQLEQQVQRLQEGVPGVPGGPRPQASAPPRPTAQYSPAPPAQYSPPPAQYSPPPGQAVASAPPSAPIGEAPSSSGRNDAFDPNRNPNAPGAPRALGTSTTATEPPPPVSDTSAGNPGARQPGAPLNLSTPSPQSDVPPGGALPAPPPSNTSATGAMQATLPPSSSPRDEYDLAYGYILRKDYALATDTFRVFLKNYPSDRLTPEAQYWLGEALFQTQHYRDAAEAFLAVSTKYDTTARAPDALLRLGQSLAALGEKEAACASLGEVLRKYPRASLSVKQNVDREQKRAHC